MSASTQLSQHMTDIVDQYHSTLEKEVVPGFGAIGVPVSLLRSAATAAQINRIDSGRQQGA